MYKYGPWGFFQGFDVNKVSRDYEITVVVEVLNTTRGSSHLMTHLFTGPHQAFEIRLIPTPQLVESFQFVLKNQGTKMRLVFVEIAV